MDEMKTQYKIWMELPAAVIVHHSWIWFISNHPFHKFIFNILYMCSCRKATFVDTKLSILLKSPEILLSSSLSAPLGTIHSMVGVAGWSMSWCSWSAGPCTPPSPWSRRAWPRRSSPSGAARHPGTPGQYTIYHFSLWSILVLLLLV